MTAAVSNKSSCNVAGFNGTSQALVLEWSDKDPDHEGEKLSRNFTILFNTNTSTGHYGVSKINGVYELRSYDDKDKDNKTILVKDIISFMPQMKCMFAANMGAAHGDPAAKRQRIS